MIAFARAEWELFEDEDANGFPCTLIGPGSTTLREMSLLRTDDIAGDPLAGVSGNASALTLALGGSGGGGGGGGYISWNVASLIYVTLRFDDFGSTVGNVVLLRETLSDGVAGTEVG